MPMQTGEAQCERLLSAACAERRAVLSGAQIKAGLGEMSAVLPGP